MIIIRKCAIIKLWGIQEMKHQLMIILVQITLKNACRLQPRPTNIAYLIHVLQPSYSILSLVQAHSHFFHHYSLTGNDILVPQGNALLFPIAIPTPRVGERRYTLHEAPPAGVYNWPQELTYRIFNKNLIFAVLYLWSIIKLVFIKFCFFIFNI